MKTKKSFKHLLEKIGNSLSELRVSKGYTSLKDFADKHDLPLIQYWRMEKGKANLTLKSLARIVSIHSLTLQDFFCELEKK
jgi:hypothetical protein